MTDQPSDGTGQTSAEAAGSIRDRLKAPADNDDRGLESRGSDVTENDFVNTDSAATLAARGGDQSQRSAGPVAPAPPPSHAPRREALDPAAAARAERKVAALFLISVAAVVAFCIAYFVVPFAYEDPDSIYFTPILAVLMGIALLGIGAGTVLWAKTLMVDEELVQDRHDLASDPQDRAEAAEAIRSGIAESGMPRRRLLQGTFALGTGSLLLLPLPFLFDLGPYAHKERALAQTAWRKGVRLVRKNGTPVRLGDLQIGSLESVYPGVPEGDRIADSPTMLIRMQPEELKPLPGREDWSVDGHIAYSVICTHLGCPIKLYEQQTHNLFCPCHQSTFDASNGAKVLFGPAARALPQLAISVDEEGYFVAQGDYSEPVGPSYWERNS